VERVDLRVLVEILGQLRGPPTEHERCIGPSAPRFDPSVLPQSAGEKVIPARYLACRDSFRDRFVGVIFGDEARSAFSQLAEIATRNGDRFLAISVLIQISFIDLDERRFEDARARCVSALDQNATLDHYGGNVWGRWGLGNALLGLGQSHEARIAFAEALDLVLSVTPASPNHFAMIASGIAHTAQVENLEAAARIRGAVEALLIRHGLHDDPRNTDLEHFFDRSLIETLGKETWTREHEAGTALTLEDAIDLTRSLAAAPAATKTVSMPT
jgi:hypothetical protein